jgi:flagellar hook protein FlgE
MTISATALTALAAASDQVDRIAERISRVGLESPGGDVVDLSEEMVGLLAAKTAFRVAIKIAQTGDEMAEHTLDLLG